MAKRHSKNLLRWPETFGTSFLRCPKCKGRLHMQKTKIINDHARKVSYICAPCNILVPAVAMMAKRMG